MRIRRYGLNKLSNQIIIHKDIDLICINKFFSSLSINLF